MEKQTQPTRVTDGGPPEELGPLVDERQRIGRIVSRLEVSADLVERADLASELVRSVSRYEDTLERAVVPHMGKSGSALEALGGDRERLRESMTVIHTRTQGIDPRNVHVSDAQGFEDTLNEVVRRLQPLLLTEDRHISAYVAGLDDEGRKSLAADIVRRFKSASERPVPPRTGIGRMISNVQVKLDHTFEDVATPSHPGADTVNG